MEQPVYDSSPSPVVTTDGGGATYEEPAPAPMVYPKVTVVKQPSDSGGGIQVPWTDILGGVGTAAAVGGALAVPYYQIKTAEQLAMRQPQQQIQVGPGVRAPMTTDNTMLWIGGATVLALIGLAVFAMRR